MRLIKVILAIFFTCLSLSSETRSQNQFWKWIADGLFLFEDGKEKITILRIDPKLYIFKLICASENDNIKMTVKRWAKRYNLISAINAGMYQKDGIKSVGYMKNFSHFNNPRLNKSFKAMLAFNPVDKNVPEIQIIDLECQNFDNLKDKYQTFIQGIRMISCKQENLWKKDDKRWTTAAFGIDKNGNALFIFGENPISVHEFINILLTLPVSIYNAMYLEGGPGASLYININNIELEKIGSYEIGSNEEKFQKVARSIPNVIGIIKRSE